MRFLFFLILPLSALAHKPYLSDFLIYEDATEISLRAEFSWALRNAVMEDSPYLKTITVSQEEFEDCILEYLNSSISIQLDDLPVSLQNITQYAGSHAHSFVFISKISNLTNYQRLTITNTCQFEQYPKKQRNTIYCKHRNQQKTCVTTTKQKACTFEF